LNRRKMLAIIARNREEELRLVTLLAKYIEMRMK